MTDQPLRATTSVGTAWFVGGPYTEFLMYSEAAARTYQRKYGGVLRSQTTTTVYSTWIDPFAAPEETA